MKLQDGDGWSVYQVKGGWQVYERVDQRIDVFGPFATLEILEDFLAARRAHFGIGEPAVYD